MKFGVREITDVTFKALQSVKIGEHIFQKGEPILYIDTAKTSTIEGSSTTVYATGGRGNARLIAWEGEKTLTFTIEDALLSTVGLKVLTGAGLFPNLGAVDTEKAMVHKVEKVFTDAEGKFILKDKDLAVDNEGNLVAPMFILPMKSGSFVIKNVQINAPLYQGVQNPDGDWLLQEIPNFQYDKVIYKTLLNSIEIVEPESNNVQIYGFKEIITNTTGNAYYLFDRNYAISVVTLDSLIKATIQKISTGDYKDYYQVTIPHLLNETVFVDYYVAKKNIVTEISIDAENFGGYYYVEGKTVFRRESDGKDLDATLTFPKVKIQSNVTLNFAGAGDPATMTFTMDAMPAYTMFEKTKKVLCAIQIIDDKLLMDENQIIDEN